MISIENCSLTIIKCQRKYGYFVKLGPQGYSTSCQFDHSSYPPSFLLHAFYCVRVAWLRRWTCSKFSCWRTMCRLKTNSKLIQGSSVTNVVLSYLIDRLECPLIMSQDLTPIGRLEGRQWTFLEREAERTLNTPATGLQSGHDWYQNLTCLYALK